MKAILEVKKGEQPYKIIRSAWLKDKDGPVLFKLLSKKRCNGQIEAVFVVERKTQKIILGRSVVQEVRFIDVASAFRKMVWQYFPNIDLQVEDVEPVDVDLPKSTSQYAAARKTKKGIFWLKLKKWLSK